jgi:uncharacterized protein with ATP-grasp and redox domains
MKTHLDCIPCFARQALEAARRVSRDPACHERILRDVLSWAADMDMNQPPPVMGQRLHRRLREIIGADDPYREAKDEQNRMASSVLAELEAAIETATDPLDGAVRLAIAGNVIDMGVAGNVTEPEMRGALGRALREPVAGDLDEFRRSVAEARSILYLSDNAGEIVFDRALIERLPPGRVTVAVRGAPIINDATRADARAARLDGLAEVIDNGSDAPGTLLEDCGPEFLRRYAEADLVLAKGQGNFETLSEERRDIFFLFKVKCPVIARHAGYPVGTHVLMRRKEMGDEEAH